MPLIPEQVLDEIQARVDIAELIGRYVPLQRAGRHFKALCPFHQERTPSFHVNTEKQIFHCFGCSVGGNVFSFLMHHERVTFPEAAERLAREVGVTLPDRASGGESQEPLYEILEKAGRYYERMLSHAQHGRPGREYLAKRGVTEQTRQAFRIGLAPDGWDRLLQASRRSNMSTELLAQAGLTLQGSKGPLDRFRQRLMFPIQDVRQRIIGFGGRSLAGQEPKYLNSPETPVYHKGRQLFGLAQAKDAIVKAKHAIVVEGYFDCVLLWQAGVQHVVSPLGTAFTPDQARLLSRYTERVILTFDADAAGEAAALRGLDVLLEAGLEVRVAQLPSDVDPDEYVQAHGTEALQQMFDKSLNVLEFLIACARKRHDIATPQGKARAAQEILSTVTKVPNMILRAEYVRLLTDAWQLDERAVSVEMRRMPASRRLPLAPARPATTQAKGAERLLAALILDRPDRWDAAQARGLLELIADEPVRHLLELVGAMRLGVTPVANTAQVLSRLAAEGSEQIEPLIVQLVELTRTIGAKEPAFEDCARRIVADGRKRELGSLRERLRAAQSSGDQPEVSRLLDAYQRLVKTHPDDAVASAAGQSGTSRGEPS